jgi:hypothetical protein
VRRRVDRGDHIANPRPKGLLVAHDLGLAVLGKELALQSAVGVTDLHRANAFVGRGDQQPTK